MSWARCKCILLLLLLSACGERQLEYSAKKEKVAELVFASGVLEADNSYSLIAQTEGYLMNLSIQEGSVIVPGQVLATIENQENNFNDTSSEGLYEIARRNTQEAAPSMMAAEKSMEIAQDKLQLDSLQFVRYSALMQEEAVSKNEFENIRYQYFASQRNFDIAKANWELVKQQSSQSLISAENAKNIAGLLNDYNQLEALIGGKVYRLYKQNGDYVKKGEVIAWVGAEDVLYAKVNVDESVIGKVTVGQSADITLNTLSEITFKGRVTEIYPAFDDESQSFLCRIDFLDSLPFKIIGTPLQTNIKISGEKEVALIPREYLSTDSTVVLKKNNEQRKVAVAFKGKEWVGIEKGISEGDVLIAADGSKKRSTDGKPAKSLDK